MLTEKQHNIIDQILKDYEQLKLNYIEINFRDMSKCKYSSFELFEKDFYLLESRKILEIDVKRVKLMDFGLFVDL